MITFAYLQLQDSMFKANIPVKIADYDHDINDAICGRKRRKGRRKGKSSTATRHIPRSLTLIMAVFTLVLSNLQLPLKWNSREAFATIEMLKNLSHRKQIYFYVLNVMSCCVYIKYVISPQADMQKGYSNNDYANQWNK